MASSVIHVVRWEADCVYGLESFPAAQVDAALDSFKSDCLERLRNMDTDILSRFLLLDTLEEGFVHVTEREPESDKPFVISLFGCQLAVVEPMLAELGLLVLDDNGKYVELESD